jgi:N-acetylmuramoyl-L-alanine amidase-like protein
MPLVPTDYPAKLAARGVPVNVFAGWESHGSSADQRAVVLHHTASGSSTRPEDDAAYCHHGSDDSPLYNVLIDRNGCAWVLAREKANSSGKINSTALNEVLAGRANLTPASQRGLSDDTSNNGALFSIAAQNNGTGEHWSDALINGMAQASACALECLGLSHAGYVTTHRALTARKIDTCGANCPDDWHSIITDALGGGRGPSEDDMPKGAQALASTPSGAGYYVVGSDGGVFAYGDAQYFGSMGGQTLAQPVVGIEVTPSGRGYWLIAQDGGIFAFGDAPFYGAPVGDVR